MNDMARNIQHDPIRDCVFCHNNGEPESLYSKHRLKDAMEYLSAYCVPVSCLPGHSHLRSADPWTMFFPELGLKIDPLGFWCPSVWNSLHVSLRDFNLSLETFRRKLKLHLFIFRNFLYLFGNPCSRPFIRYLDSQKLQENDMARNIQHDPIRDCVFCHNNGEPESVYSKQQLKDAPETSSRIMTSSRPSIEKNS